MRTVPVSANLTRFLPLFLPLEHEIATSVGKNGILPKNRIIPERGPRRIARMRTNNLPNQPRRDSSLRACIYIFFRSLQFVLVTSYCWKGQQTFETFTFFTINGDK